jgi:glycine/D-amino acid oxidase-like deaminating enzyme
MSSAKTSVVILGAGVTGLTTATELLARHQHPQEQQLSITLVAKYYPGDLAPDTDYCSTQAGAMWMSTETEFNRLAAYEKVAYGRFLRIAEMHAESGVRRLPLRRVYGPADGDGDARPEGKTWWFEQLVGGIQAVSKEDLPEDAAGGVDWTTVVINPSVYLTWYVFLPDIRILG